jgi:hypothetical protein
MYKLQALAIARAWSFYIVNALFVIPTEPSASGRRGINAKRFADAVQQKESLRGDPSTSLGMTERGLRTHRLPACAWSFYILLRKKGGWQVAS